MQSLAAKKYTVLIKREMVISASEALSLQRCWKSSEKMAIEKLTEGIEQSIRSNSTQGLQQMMYTIPSSIFGVADFDRYHVCKEVIEVFRAANFVITRDLACPFTFLLSWAAPPSREVFSKSETIAAPVSKPKTPSFFPPDYYDPAPQLTLPPPTRETPPDDVKVVTVVSSSTKPKKKKPSTAKSVTLRET